jgi:hypothetical protein
VKALNIGTTSLVLLHLTLAIACAGKQYTPSWPERGFPVYISKELQPDSDNVAPGVDFPNPQPDQGTVDSRIMEPRVGSSPHSSRLPACEPVEVRAVHKTSLRVKWSGEYRHSSTLNGDWSTLVHRSREECVERMKTLWRPK